MMSGRQDDLCILAAVSAKQHPRHAQHANAQWLLRMWLQQNVLDAIFPAGLSTSVPGRLYTHVYYSWHNMHVMSHVLCCDVKVVYQQSYGCAMISLRSQ